MSENGENTIRVLIVDDIAETRENIRKLLQFEPDLEVVGAARTGIEAIDIARETEPDVVIMDINMPDMDGITATEALLRDVPFAQIVMLSVNNDADYVRRAMRAGARDFLAKPPSGDELIATIRTLSEFAHEQKDKLASPLPVVAIPGAPAGYTGPLRPQGKVIALYSPKGGVGCTMVATNLAVGLNNADTPAALVDANLQFGDVAVALNLQAKNSFVDLASRAEELDEDFVESVLLRHDATNLHVLAAPVRPEMADEVSADQVRNVLQFLKKKFAYVVVDTSSTMDDITLAVLDVTDILVTIATPEIPSIKDTRLLIDLLGVLEFPKERLFFVINKMDKRSNITVDAVGENLKISVDGEIPLDEKTITTSINKGSPILVSDKGQPVAKAILQILGNLKERLLMEPEVEEEEQEGERSKLFSR
jgi:pilus assembly protein CpaE